jgi:predicted ATPase
MIHLQSITRRPWPARLDAEFPFSIPVIRSLETLEFKTPVTFLVGENGSGKSTVLEALACAVESITVGAESVRTDRSLGAQRELAKYFKPVWTKRTRKGFFLRAEDFFGYAKRLVSMRAEMEDELREIDVEFQGRSATAIGLAKMAFGHELADMQRRYGAGLDVASHGESFIALFKNRFVPGGLYLLDEPEAPLSPIRQLGLISLLKEMVAQQAQFIISTHSPILMAYPGATILSFDGGQIRPARYEDLEQVALLRDFLNDPPAFTERL